MVFAANKLRLHPELGNPTVLIVVDRIDLDTQITATFNATDVPNTVTAQTRDELQNAARPRFSQSDHHDDPQVRRGGGVSTNEETSSFWLMRPTEPKRRSRSRDA